MRLLDKRALEKSVSIKKHRKEDVFTRRREGKIMESEKKSKRKCGATALREPLNLPLSSKSF